jgi:hypothetical protein
VRLIVRAIFLACLLATGCRAGGCLANSFGDVVGYSGDAYCDRRFVSGDAGAASFCQEIVDTIAVGQFQDDCRSKHAAAAGEGRCPKERRLGGCKLHKVNDDGSEVWDWFYDVGDIADAPKTKDDVRKACADPQRYEEGATYQDP